MKLSAIRGFMTRSRWRAVVGVAASLSMMFGGFATASAGPDQVIGRISAPLSQPGFAAIVPAGAPVENATLINSVVLGALNPPIIDSAGIAYLSDQGEFLISDSEVDEEPSVFQGVNLFQITKTGSITATGMSPDIPVEPTGLSDDPANRRLFITNDRSERMYVVEVGFDGVFGTGDDAFTSFSLAAFGAVDSEDVAFDTRSGHLFVADGIGDEIYRIDPGLNGTFDGVSPEGDDIVTSFDISGTEIDDAEGIGYRPSTDTLLVVDAGLDESIFEFTKSGHLLRRIDLGVIKQVGVPETPSDVVIAPASDGSGVDHLYVVDRKADNGDPGDDLAPPQDGTLYELSAPFADLPPFVDAGSDAVVTIGAGAQLDGLAYDDNQPAIDSLTTEWSVLSGPGQVSFGSPSATTTSASFGASGTYVLQLTASDTRQSTPDTVEITVIPDPLVNTAPVPDAGPDVAVLLNEGAVLGGSVIDDGLPDPPGALTHSWTKQAGPGSVTFTNPNALATSASFSTFGDYIIRLTSSDSQLSGFDEVVVRVSPNPQAPLNCNDEEFAGAAFSDLSGLSGEVVDAVDCLVFFEIAKGTSTSTFTPFDDVSRWQMALFLTRQARVQGLTLPDGTGQGFEDIDAYPAATQVAINQLAQMGITVGTAPGQFSPAESVSRWQMALFLARYLDSVGVSMPSGSDQGYSDIGELPLATQTAINQITQLAVAQGTGPGSYSPSSDVTRWQMALFLVRSLDVGGFG